MPNGSTFDDEGTMKEPLVIDTGIPMVVDSSGAHEATTSTQQMPMDAIGKSFDTHLWEQNFQVLIKYQTCNFFSFQTLICTHLHLCCLLFGTLIVGRSTNAQMYITIGSKVPNTIPQNT
jgi:hypothetical protein